MDDLDAPTRANEVQQGFVVPTQDITRSATIVITLVTLGVIPASVNAAPYGTTLAKSGIGTPVAVTPTSEELSQMQIAAIIGCVVGFIVLVLLISLWCRCRRRPASTPRSNRYPYYRETYPDLHPMLTAVTGPEGYRMRGAWYRAPLEAERRRAARQGRTLNIPGEGLIPPPPHFPPTPMQTHLPYRATREPQIPGVSRYP